jgi:hypothetical protein
MSKTIKRMEKFLDEGIASGLERFDVPKEIMLDVGQIGKDLVKLSQKGKKMEGKVFLSGMKNYYDELYEYIRDMEDHLGGY